FAAERQRPVRGGVFGRTEALAARGELAGEAGSVPARHAVGDVLGDLFGFSEGGDRGGQRIEFRLGRGHEPRQLGRSFARGRRGDGRGKRCVVLGEGRSDDAACSQKGQGSRRRGLQSECPVHRRREIRGFG